MKTIKILVAYGKEDFLLKDNICVPVDNSIAGSELQEQTEKWLKENTFVAGETEVSTKVYASLAAIYHCWKNPKLYDNPDFVGIMLQRKHLLFSGGDKPEYTYGNLNESYLKLTGYSEENIQKLTDEYSLIIQKPYYRASIREYFVEKLGEQRLKLVESYVNNTKYKQSVNEYFADTRAYLGGMFLMRKDLFEQFCEFLFGCLLELQKNPAFENFEQCVFDIAALIRGIFFTQKRKEIEEVLELPMAVSKPGCDIIVVLASDNKYAFPCGVTITSLFANANPDTHYHVKILVSEDFSKSNKIRIQSLCKTYTNHQIEFLQMSSDTFSGVKLNTSHLSVVTFYRLLAPQLFPYTDRILYLDTDTIIFEDLKHLYFEELGDNLIAGVKAPTFHTPIERRAEKEAEIGVPADDYVNAGVLLFNLEAMRREGTSEAFIEIMGNGYSSEDQDVINIVCSGRKKLLPFRYNAQNKYLNPNDAKMFEKARQVFSDEEISDAMERPAIRHFTNRGKPWDYFECYGGELWLEYAKLSPFDEITKSVLLKKEFYQSAVGLDDKSYVSRILLQPNRYITQKYAVSIIIPVYNNENVMRETLESVIVQTSALRDIEVVCVNDGSTDRSLRNLCKYSEKYPFIKVYSQENKGAGPARNLGLSKAQGEFVMFLDADDMYASYRTVCDLYLEAKKQNTLVAGGSWSRFTDKEANFQANYGVLDQPRYFTENAIIEYEDWQYHWGYQQFIFNLKMLKDNNIYFPDYLRHQDPPFFVKAMYTAKKFAVIPDVVYRYRKNWKKIDFDARKTCDFFTALMDLFEFSKEKNLARLHTYTFLEYCLSKNKLVDRLKLGKGNAFLISLLPLLYRSIDLNLLQRSGIPFDENEYGSPAHMYEMLEELK